ncbi:MAG: DUF1285 domain-containing protein [Hyphomicrobiaceae bacterium]
MTKPDENTHGERLEISGLSQLLAAAAKSPLPPVETWNPAYCGDIGLKIRADGRWLYGDSEIKRPAMVRLFSRVLICEKNGRHYLVTPVEKVDVSIEDAPFVAVEMQVAGEGEDQTLSFRTNVDDIVQCSKAHPLSFVLVPPDDGLKPYLLVRGRLKARVSRALLYDLVALAETRTIDGAQVLGVTSGGAFFPLQPSTGPHDL